MTSDQQLRPRRHTRVWLALTVLAVLLILIFVPPLVSIARYKNRVTQLVSAALHRPVRMSSVELRVLPRPGFLLSDFTVQEDPAYGYEPVLHANTVRASIRLSSLWRGQLQISRISVDEASLNLVHATSGRWNVEALFQTAAQLRTGQQSAVPLPYMEATNSRVNVKNGLEKLPYSLVSADASLWQEDGAWRVRLRGQPARTDVTLDLPDTGILRAEATLHPAAQLEQMPLHLDLDWRQAQLGQLSRLVLGSDEGWRGDLTGELHLDGTSKSAKITSRLRAAGVHRVEFTPQEPLDFDANCAFTYHGTTRAVDDLLCKSPVGDGRARLTGSIPQSDRPRLTLELDRVPAQAGLDMLRTMRRNLDESLEAAGTVSGKMTYERQIETDAGVGGSVASAKPQSPFTGSFVIEGLRVNGANLSAPIVVPKVTLEPASITQAGPASHKFASPQGHEPFLATTVTLPADAPAPLTVTAAAGLRGFELSMRGSASLPRLRDFAHLAGAPTEALSDLSGATATLSLTSEGQWLPNEQLTLANMGAPAAAAGREVNGEITLHDATWKPAFLPNPVTLAAATLHIQRGAVRWDPVSFTWGAVKGTATFDLPEPCAATETCQPIFNVHFGLLDGASAQAAVLGGRTSGTVLTDMLARFKASTPAPWPQLKGSVLVDALILGPFTFNDVNAEILMENQGAEVPGFRAKFLGGNIAGTASMQARDKPSYTVKATLTELNPQAVGRLVGQRWAGGTIEGAGNLVLAGYTDADIDTSVKGTLHFDWRNGSVAGTAPPALGRFDRWSGDLVIGDKAFTLGQNQVQLGTHKTQVSATAPFNSPTHIVFSAAPANREKQ